MSTGAEAEGIDQKQQELQSQIAALVAQSEHRVDSKNGTIMPDV